MSFNISLSRLKNILVFGLLFLAAMNFHASFFYIVIVLFGVLLIVQKKFLLNQYFLIYLALSGIMVLFGRSEGLYGMIQCISYVLLYLIGYNIITVSLSNNIHDFKSENDFLQKKASAVIATICAGAFLHYILNFLFNFNQSIGRNTNDIWTGTVMSATVQASLACLMLGLSVSMILAPVKKLYRYIGCISLFGIIIYDLILACRTMFVMLIILFIIGVLYMQKILNTSQKKIRFYIGLLICLLVISFLYFSNAAGIREYVLNSNLFRRFDISNGASFVDDRLKNKIAFILNGYKHPFGGLYMRSEFGYAHDLLLDGYDKYGIIALIILILIIIFGIVEFVRFVNNTPYTPEFKLAFICVYSAMLIEFCIEPILDGMSWFFAFYCLINGCIVGLNRSAITEGSSNENIAN